MKDKYVLGICMSDHDASSCLMKNNEILVAVTKERVTRKKRHGCTKVDFDNECVKYCIDYAGIKLDEIDMIVQNSIFSDLSDKNYYNLLDHYKGSTNINKRLIDMEKHSVKSISHHLAHAYNSYYLSEFDEAVVLVLDSMGNEDNTIKNYFEGEDSEYLKKINYLCEGGWERESVYIAKDGELEPIYKRFERDAQPYDSKVKGFGIMYHEVSEYIFGDGHKAGETMGLAPFGSNELDFEIVKFDGQQYSFNDEWLEKLDRPFMNGDNWEERHGEFARLSYKVQDELEKALIRLCNIIYEKTKIPNLCLSGGVALNSVANGKLLKNTPFKNIFVPPAAGDSGISIGCAMYGYKKLGGKNKDINFNNDYLGKIYSDRDIEEAFSKLNVKYEKADDIVEKTAKWLEDGKIIGWFQGGSEFGPRALGHRSILCHANTIEMKNRLNAKIKFRQAFRPFAPSVLEEYAHEYFDIEKKSPYMLFVTDVKEDKLDKIPAVVHVDGTARVQTVNKSDNDIYYDLINTYYNKTGVPVILNTSFNINGMPIVESPEDAIDCFLKTNIEILVIGKYYVLKEEVY